MAATVPYGGHTKLAGWGLIYLRTQSRGAEMSLSGGFVDGRLACYCNHPPPKSSRPYAVVATATRMEPGEDSMRTYRMGGL